MNIPLFITAVFLVASHAHASNERSVGHPIAIFESEGLTTGDPTTYRDANLNTVRMHLSYGRPYRALRVAQALIERKPKRNERQ